MFLSIVSVSGYFHDSQCHNTSGPPSHLYKFLMPLFAMELLSDSFFESTAVARKQINKPLKKLLNRHSILIVKMQFKTTNFENVFTFL